jgi:hypothetical protein
MFPINRFAPAADSHPDYLNQSIDSQRPLSFASRGPSDQSMRQSAFNETKAFGKTTHYTRPHTIPKLGPFGQSQDTCQRFNSNAERDGRLKKPHYDKPFLVATKESSCGQGIIHKLTKSVSSFISSLSSSKP